MDLKISQYNFFGLKVSNLSKKELITFCDETILASETIICYGYSFGIIPLFKKYPHLSEIINSYDINVTDGTLFYWFMNIMGYRINSFISIPNMTIDLLNYANDNQKSVLLLGADRKTNQKATSNLRISYPAIHFFEGVDGYFDEDNEIDIINYINQCSPTILLIGISSPIKENFAYKYKNQINSNIIIPCGGMIDVFSGKVRLAHPFAKKLGLATLVRIIQEPKRHLVLNLWLSYETFFKIIPVTLWELLVRRNKHFRIPSIYKGSK